MEKVWYAITETEQLSQWMPGRVEIELEVGGKVRWSFPEEAWAQPDGTVTALDPPRLLEFFMPAAGAGLDWLKDETLRFELTPAPEGCLLVFTDVVEDRAGAASFAAGWQGCLDVLAALLGGGPAESDEDPARYVELFEEYMRSFGLDEGTAQPGADGWTVRFERQLMGHGVDEVWRALAGQEDAASGGTAAGEPVVGGPPPLAMTNGYVPAGAVTAVEAPGMLECAWGAEDGPAGRVRWELREGPGGARVVLTQTLPGEAADELLTALAAWHTHLELFARSLRGEDVCPWPEGRTRELRAHYEASLAAR